MEQKVTINRTANVSWLSQWPQWAGNAAAIWSLIYGLLGLYWLWGGPGFPFGVNDPRGEMMGSFLSDISITVGGTIIASAGLVGTIVALATAGPKDPHWVELWLKN